MEPTEVVRGPLEHPGYAVCLCFEGMKSLTSKVEAVGMRTKMCTHAQDIPAATESAGQAAAAVDGVFHVLAAGEEAAQEEQEGQEQGR